MAEIKLSTYANLMSSLNAVKTAANDVDSMTRTHAEAHFAKLDALRKGQEHEQAINDGITRATSQV
jgi:hypothetical protein